MQELQILKLLALSAWAFISQKYTSLNVARDTKAIPAKVFENSVVAPRSLSKSFWLKIFRYVGIIGLNQAAAVPLFETSIVKVSCYERFTAARVNLVYPLA